MALPWARQTLADASVSASQVEAITSWPIEELQKQLRARCVRCTVVLASYFIKAHAAQEKANCVVHVFAAEAIAAAKDADARYQQHAAGGGGGGASSGIPPLLGVPISIKDSTDVQGADSTCGLYRRCLKPAAADAACVALLRRSGAIIFVKTNIPALLMSYECRNDVFGTGTNPVNSKYTCGGSSGGEGALIRLCGSPGGMGSDVGGSIRIPSHCCGIYGLKPSYHRVAYRGCQPEQGNEGIVPVAGPMARSVADLAVLFEALQPADVAGLDGLTFNVPFNHAMYRAYREKKNLKLLYYLHDGFVATSPPCRRAVQLAITALQREGHSVTLLAHNATDAMQVFYECFAADRCRTMIRELDADRPFGVIQPSLELASVPDRLKGLLGYVMGVLVDPVFGRILSQCKEKTVDEHFDLLIRRDRLRHWYSEKMQGFDGLIAPGFYTPAPPCDSTTDLSFGCGACALFNVLDLPVVAVPVTTVDAVVDGEPWESASPQQGHRKLTKAMRDGVRYDVKKMAGLPCGVQVVAPRMREEQALGIAFQLQAALGKQ